jgi:hypothetical protein
MACGGYGLRAACGQVYGSSAAAAARNRDHPATVQTRISQLNHTLHNFVDMDAPLVASRFL